MAQSLPPHKYATGSHTLKKVPLCFYTRKVSRCVQGRIKQWANWAVTPSPALWGSRAFTNF